MKTTATTDCNISNTVLNDDTVGSIKELDRKLQIVQDKLQVMENMGLQEQLTRIEKRLNGNLPDKEYNDVESYPQQSTCHGIRYIFDTSTAAPRRVIWLLIYIVCISWYLYFSVSAFILFFGFPVTTNTEYTYVSAMDFPAMTICPTFLLRESYYNQSVANGSITAFTSFMEFVRQQVALQKIQLNTDENLEGMTELELEEIVGDAQFKALYSQFYEAQDHTNFEYHYKVGGFSAQDIIVIKGNKCILHMNFTSDDDFECSTTSFMHPENFLMCHTISFSSNEKPVEATPGQGNLVLELRVPEDAIKIGANDLFYINMHAVGDFPANSNFKTMSQESNYFQFSLKVTNITSLPWPHGNCENTMEEDYKHHLNNFPHLL